MRGLSAARCGLSLSAVLLFSRGVVAVESDLDAPGTSSSARPPGAGSYYRFQAGVGLGRGMRFNNPYRLQTQLGDDAESLSLTAPFAAAWASLSYGHVWGIFHGVACHLSFSTEGIRQEVLTPGYAALLPLSPRWSLTARAGVPIVLEPDANVGGELAAGGSLLLTAGMALTAELSGSLFYGAATLDTPRTAIPILSAQIGAALDYEVLP